MEKQCKERREWSDKATGKKLELAALTGVEGTTGNGTQAKPIKGKGRPYIKQSMQHGAQTAERHKYGIVSGT